jgi:hypothetical protein
MPPESGKKCPIRPPGLRNGAGLPRGTGVALLRSNVCAPTCTPSKEAPMIWTIFVILLVLWLLGLVSSYTMGGFIHILLVLAIVVLLFQLIGGRRVV